MVGAMPPKRWL